MARTASFNGPPLFVVGFGEYTCCPPYRMALLPCSPARPAETMLTVALSTPFWLWMTGGCTSGDVG